jgi:hypothetical protein
VDKHCFLKHVIEEKTLMMGRRERRRKQLLDDLKEKRNDWNLKEGSLDRTVWRTRLGRGCGPVARQKSLSINNIF